VKSNRAQADYFELLICEYICNFCNLKFEFSSDLEYLFKKTLLVPNGKVRLELQKSNFERLKPVIKKILETEIDKNGKVVKIA